MNRTGPAYHFNRALVRQPADTIAGGLRGIDAGDPDVSVFRTEHDHYCRALADAGLDVVRLPPLDEFPDSVFVEDPAFVLPEGAILLRSGAASRAGEAAHLAATLETFRPLLRLKAGFVDGGDVLVTGSEVIVGLSARTDREGFAALNTVLASWGYESRCVQPPDGLLHLKTGCSLVDDNTILVIADIIRCGLFEGYDLIELPAGEEAAANAIRINDHVLISAGHHRTANRLSDLGYHVVEVPTSQAALLDGGLSCMSLRF